MSLHIFKALGMTALQNITNNATAIVRMVNETVSSTGSANNGTVPLDDTNTGGISNSIIAGAIAVGLAAVVICMCIRNKPQAGYEAINDNDGFDDDETPTDTDLVNTNKPGTSL